MTIRHDRALELAAAAIDFDLDPPDRAALAEHLAACAACRQTAAGLRADAAAIGRSIAHGRPTERVLHAVIAAARQPPHPRTRVRAGTALVAALAALLMVGGGMIAGQGLELVRVPPAVTTDLAWSLADPAAFPTTTSRAQVAALAAVPGPSAIRLAAGGTVDGRARMWLSTDGTQWQPVDAPAFARGRIEGVAASTDRLVAVGSQLDRTGDVAGAIWSSTDGEAWTIRRVAGARTLLAVAASPGAFVAAGAPRAGTEQPLWVSEDGRDWTPIADATPFRGATVTGLAQSGARFIAVGYDDRGGAVWTSVDGREWTRTTSEGAFARMRIAAVATTPAGLVAVGWQARDPGAAPVAWTSLVGTSWVRREVDASVADARIATVAATAYGAIAFGTADGATVAWVSADGREWRLLDHTPWPGDTMLHAASALGGRVVVAGERDGAAVLWTGDPP